MGTSADSGRAVEANDGTTRRGTADGAEGMARGAQVRPEPVPDEERPCVLVVEDDAHDREIYGRLLCYNGFDVVFAGTGQEALDRARQYPPALVLLDMALPDLQGLDVCVQLRQQGLPDSVPVVALSGFPAAGMGGRALEAGCVRYIEKPASPMTVLHEVEDLIGRAPLPGVGRPPITIEPSD